MPVPPADIASPPGDPEAEERRLRASVHARVATLRQIQTLLDAAILQMNAYMLATTTTATNDAAPSASSASSPADKKAEETKPVVAESTRSAKLSEDSQERFVVFFEY